MRMKLLVIKLTFNFMRTPFLIWGSVAMATQCCVVIVAHWNTDNLYNYLHCDLRCSASGPTQRTPCLRLMSDIDTLVLRLRTLAAVKLSNIIDGAVNRLSAVYSPTLLPLTQSWWSSLTSLTAVKLLCCLLLTFYFVHEYSKVKDYILM